MSKRWCTYLGTESIFDTHLVFLWGLLTVKSHKSVNNNKSEGRQAQILVTAVFDFLLHHICLDQSCCWRQGSAF